MSFRTEGEALVLPRTASLVRGRYRKEENRDQGSLTTGPNDLPLVDSMKVKVEAGSEELTLFLSGRNSSMSTWAPEIAMISPSGKIYNKESSSNVFIDPFYVILKVNQPEAGEWRIFIASSNSSPQSSFVAANVRNPKPDFYIDADPKQMSVSEPVTISLSSSYIADLDESVNYTAYVERPDKSIVPVRIGYDERSQATAGTFTEFNGKGVYRVVAFAKSSDDTQIMKGEAIFGGPETPAIDLEAFERFAQDSSKTSTSS